MRIITRCGSTWSNARRSLYMFVIWGSIFLLCYISFNQPQSRDLEKPRNTKTLIFHKTGKLHTSTSAYLDESRYEDEGDYEENEEVLPDSMEDPHPHQYDEREYEDQEERGNTEVNYPDIKNQVNEYEAIEKDKDVRYIAGEKPAENGDPLIDQPMPAQMDLADQSQISEQTGVPGDGKESTNNDQKPAQNGLIDNGGKQVINTSTNDARKQAQTGQTDIGQKQAQIVLTNQKPAQMGVADNGQRQAQFVLTNDIQKSAQIGLPDNVQKAAESIQQPNRGNVTDGHVESKMGETPQLHLSENVHPETPQVQGIENQVLPSQNEPKNPIIPPTPTPIPHSTTHKAKPPKKKKYRRIVRRVIVKYKDGKKVRVVLPNKKPSTTIVKKKQALVPQKPPKQGTFTGFGQFELNSADSLFNNIFSQGDKVLEGMPMLTIFTTFLPDPSRRPIHLNVIKNWRNISDAVKPVLFITKAMKDSIPDVIQAAKMAGWTTVPVPRVNEHGTPYLREMFHEANATIRSVFYCYANPDVLFDDTITSTLQNLLKMFKSTMRRGILVVGKRKLFHVDDNFQQISAEQFENASLASAFDSSAALDYFIIARNLFPWRVMPEFVVHRPYYGNYLVALAKKYDIATVDATKTLNALHLQRTRDDGAIAQLADRDYNWHVLKGLQINREDGYTDACELETGVFIPNGGTG